MSRAPAAPEAPNHGARRPRSASPGQHRREGADVAAYPRPPPGSDLAGRVGCLEAAPHRELPTGRPGFQSAVSGRPTSAGLPGHRAGGGNQVAYSPTYTQKQEASFRSSTHTYQVPRRAGLGATKPRVCWMSTLSCSKHSQTHLPWAVLPGSVAWPCSPHQLHSYTVDVNHPIPVPHLWRSTGDGVLTT